MFTAMEMIEKCGVVPVVVLRDANNAVPTAQAPALLAGGVNVMEITFRTDAAQDSIRAVAESCPDMLVGAGTVVNLEQLRLPWHAARVLSCRQDLMKR